MFIETELTPNPETIKFLPGVAVLPTSTLQINTKEEAEASPLAKMLFDVGGVEGVYLGADFISVTKVEAEDWIDLKPVILSTLMQFFMTGDPVLAEGVNLNDAEDIAEEDRAIVEQIKTLLEERVRPAVAQDGGDIVFHGYKEGVVYLQMQGACAGCPSATMTLKNGVENLLKYFVPEVVDVRQI